MNSHISLLLLQLWIFSHKSNSSKEDELLQPGPYLMQKRHHLCTVCHRTEDPVPLRQSSSWNLPWVIHSHHRQCLLSMDISPDSRNNCLHAFIQYLQHSITTWV